MKFKYAASSLDRLELVHQDLKMVFLEAKLFCTIDFDISCGHRTKEQQTALYMAHKSQLDGIAHVSKHQQMPAEAVDIYAYKPHGKASYSVSQLCYIAGVIQCIALQLLDEGAITHNVRWGGNWDRDGEIITDQTFQDLCHFELVE